MNEFEYTILQNNQMNVGQLVVMPEQKEMPEITDGIVFVLATWSGSSIHCFLLLTKLLSKFSKSIKLYVLNNDILAIDSFLKQGIVIPQGWGETYLIHDGKIIHCFSRYNEENTQEILLQLRSMQREI